VSEERDQREDEPRAEVAVTTEDELDRDDEDDVQLHGQSGFARPE
jgi:hypothetical protein